MRDLVAYTWPTPGLTMATAEWFHDHDVAAVATDTLVLEVYPVRVGPDLYLPVHLLHLVEMGMTQGQNWFLDELADACAADGRYEFLLDATPAPLHQRPGLAGQSGGRALTERRAAWAVAPRRSAHRPDRVRATSASVGPLGGGLGRGRLDLGGAGRGRSPAHHRSGPGQRDLGPGHLGPVGGGPAGHRPVEQSGLAVDQRGGADAPELEAVAVAGHLGQHGDEGPGRGHRVGAGRRARAARRWWR